MMKDEKDLLYQELPSIKPRISREERLNLKRKGGCIDCSPNLEKAKKGSRTLYFFYIVLLAIGIIATQLHQRFNRDSNTIKINSKTMNISFSKKINISLIDQPNRYGLSLLFRNNSSKDWKLTNIQLIYNKTMLNDSISINQTIKGKHFYTMFIPISQEIQNINNVEVVTIP